MEKEYNFSKAERGKFFKEGAKLNIPIYLEPNALQFVEKIANRKEKDISTIVNELIETDIHLADVIQ